MKILIINKAIDKIKMLWQKCHSILFCIGFVVSAKKRFHFFAFCEKMETPYLLFADNLFNFV